MATQIAYYLSYISLITTQKSNHIMLNATKIALYRVKLNKFTILNRDQIKIPQEDVKIQTKFLLEVT